ncbi:MAG: 2-oxoglutarate dehydrogenase E2 component (dihydrolipoamide succinyltransferase), partial [Polaromonas sp.]
MKDKTMTIEVRVPTLGESVTEATVATWFKKPGDAVAVDEMLCELETDKVTVEVSAPAAGTLGEIVAAEGETVGADALLATLTEGTSAAPAPKAKAASAKEEAPAATGKNTDVMVPTLGESVSEATVSTWFKKVGDTVTQDEMLCELETDKVSVEVPAPASGTLTEILAPEGSTVDASAKLAVIGGASAQASAPATAAAPPAASTSKDVEDAPSAKKIMADKGIDPANVQGSGRDGRIMKEDALKAVIAPAPAPAPAAAPAPTAMPRAPVAADDAAREERVKMTRLRQTIARRLKDSQNTAAMLTTYNEVDMTEVMSLRKEYKDLFEKKHGVK